MELLGKTITKSVQYYFIDLWYTYKPQRLITLKNARKKRRKSNNRSFETIKLYIFVNAYATVAHNS